VLSVINDLVMTAEEFTWKRNTLLSKLYEMEKLVDGLSDTDSAIVEFKQEVKNRISECLSLLEDIESEE
jgi:hypothetical protein